MEIRFINETEIILPKAKILVCVKEAVLSKKDANIALVAVRPSKIRKLNKIYFGTDKVTDVLSFNNDNKLEKNGYMGEIVFCPSFIKKQSKNFHWELCHAVTHGALHLLGTQHEKSQKAYEAMHAIEIDIVNKIFK